jgi:hypothetical protein
MTHLLRWLHVVLLAAVCLLPTLPVAAQSGDGAWSLEEYQRLSLEMELADEERVLTTQPSDEWRQATEESIRTRRTLIAFLSRSLRDGSMEPTYATPARAARLLLIQNIVVLNIELGLCEQARTASRLLDDNVGQEDAEVAAARESARERLERCVNTDTQTPGDVASTPGPDPGMTQAQPAPTAAARPPRERPAREPSPANPRRTAGLALLGAGGVSLVTGIVLDIANANGPRAEFTELRDRCPAECDTARLNELSGQIDRARLPIGLTTFGGIGLAAAGTVLLVTSRGASESRAVSFVPEWQPGYAGVRLRFRR